MLAAAARRGRPAARAGARAVAAHADGLGLRHRSAVDDVSQGDVDRRARAAVRRRDAVRPRPPPAPDRRGARRAAAGRASRRATSSACSRCSCSSSWSSRRAPRELERRARLERGRRRSTTRSPRERKLATRIALAASLPDWLAARLVADWGDEAEPLALALNQRAPMTVRANLLVGDRDALAAELARARARDRGPARGATPRCIVETPHEPVRRSRRSSAARWRRRTRAASCSRTSRSPAPAQQGRSSIDLCAGAGGKTLAIAARLGNRGRIVATDVDAQEARRAAPARPPRRACRTRRRSHLEGGTLAAGARRAARQGRRRVRRCAVLGHRRAAPQPRGALAAARSRPRDVRRAAAGDPRRRARAARARRPAGLRDLHAARRRERRGRRGGWSAPELGAVPLDARSSASGRAALGDGDGVHGHAAPHGTDGFYAQVMRASIRHSRMHRMQRLGWTARMEARRIATQALRWQRARWAA